MQPNSYRIFWDLEMLTEKLTPEEKTKLTHTERLQMHKPCGYCYVVVRMDSSLNYEIMSHDLYRGPDALEKFVIKIEEELANIQEDLSAPAEMIMAPGEDPEHVSYNSDLSLRRVYMLIPARIAYFRGVFKFSYPTYPCF